MGMGAFYGVGAGVAEGLDQLVKQRLLEARIREMQEQAELQRQQQAQMAAYREKALAQDESQFGRSHGLQREQFTAGTPLREAQTAGALLGNRKTSFDLGRAETEAARTDAAEAALSADPKLAPILRLVRVGARPPAATDPTGDVAISEAEKDRRAMLTRARITADRAGALSGASESALIGRIQARYDRVTKDYRTTRAAVADMESALASIGKLTNNQPIGESIIVKYEKILDPQSVVREGEYARVGNGQPLFARIQRKWEELTSGAGPVQQADLKSYVNLVRTYHQNQKSWARKERDLAKRQAARYNIPEDVVLPEDPDLEASPVSTDPNWGK